MNTFYKKEDADNVLRKTILEKIVTEYLFKKQDYDSKFYYDENLGYRIYCPQLYLDIETLKSYISKYVTKGFKISYEEILNKPISAKDWEDLVYNLTYNLLIEKYYQYNQDKLNDKFLKLKDSSYFKELKNKKYFYIKSINEYHYIQDIYLFEPSENMFWCDYNPEIYITNTSYEWKVTDDMKFYKHKPIRMTYREIKQSIKQSIKKFIKSLKELRNKENYDKEIESIINSLNDTIKVINTTDELKKFRDSFNLKDLSDEEIIKNNIRNIYFDEDEPNIEKNDSSSPEEDISGLDFKKLLDIDNDEKYIFQNKEYYINYIISDDELESSKYKVLYIKDENKELMNEKSRVYQAIKKAFIRDKEILELMEK